MSSNIQKTLKSPAFIIGAFVLLAILVLLFIGSKVKDSTNSVTGIAEYNVLLQDTQIKINLFLVGRATLGEIRGQLSKLAIVPKELRDVIQIPQIREIREKIEEIEGYRKNTKSLTTDIIRLTDESVLKADIYMPYVRDQLLKDRAALSNLEIQTIVGATTHIKTNFQIQSLYIQTLSDPSLYSELKDFLTISVRNVEADYQALIGTPFEENTREAMEISHEIQKQVDVYLEQIEQVRVLTGNIEDNIKSISVALEEVRKDALNNTSTNIGTVMAILIAGLVGIILLVLIVGWFNKGSDSTPKEA